MHSQTLSISDVALSCFTHAGQDVCTVSVNDADVGVCVLAGAHKSSSRRQPGIWWPWHWQAQTARIGAVLHTTILATDN